MNKSLGIVLHKYKYIVSVNHRQCTQICKSPKKITIGVRRNRYIYDNGQFKKIIYPSELLFTYVDESDIVENHIMKLRNEWPNWYAIHVEKFE